MSPPKIKTIGVLTSGGDCSGMNPCIRAVVRSAISNGLKVYGIIRGYDGLINGELKVMDRRSVSSIISQGGTILKTARSQEFMTKEGRKKAYETLKKHEIDGLIVIGGNGSFQGAHKLCEEFGVRCVGVPGTIDNDLNGTDYSIGSFTAVGVALDAIDKIRDTVSSLERIFVVEVMGRECGYIAMHVALASGAEEVLLPDMKYDLDKVCDEIRSAHKKGKVSWIIVVAEGVASAQSIADIITKKTGYETRTAVLGHIQRGGSPAAFDRLLASRLGASAVTLLLQGGTDKMVGIISGQVEATDFSYACEVKKGANRELYKLLKILES